MVSDFIIIQQVQLPLFVTVTQTIFSAHGNVDINRRAMLLFALFLCNPHAHAEPDTRFVPFEVDIPVHDPRVSKWRVARKPQGDEPIELTVAVRVDVAGRDALERDFWAVSDPGHERYGHHLSVHEIRDRLAVPRARTERVRLFFARAGATSIDVNPFGDMMTVRLSVDAADRALHTDILEYFHVEKPTVRIFRASSRYSLPAKIATDVSLIGELLHFPALNGLLRSHSGKGSWPNDCSAMQCEGKVTPGVLLKRYKTPETVAAVQGNSMAVAEFQGEYFNQKDLDRFTSECHRNATVDRVVGKNKGVAGGETMLDIEYIRAMAPNVPLSWVYNTEYSLLKWANQITADNKSALVHSVSYGNDEVQQTSQAYMYTTNTAFMKAGARGLSILFASGDQGVCGRTGCTHQRFKPDFPGGSPYVTLVGGTNFVSNDIGDESVWSDGGGGFSDTFPIPSYQADAVAAYKQNPDADLPPQSWWNGTGRGYPDVAALGGGKAPYCISEDGSFDGGYGTSASAPVVAGVFALLNGIRLKTGKSPLGFLNPFIYKNPSGFQDVTQGSNPGGGKYGFKAVKGWDPASGWGTPNYEALAKAVEALN